MLAHDVLLAGERAGHELYGVDLPEVDITDPASVRAAIADAAPGAILNLAAWTDVDGAESHRAEAFAVNGEGAGNVARAAAAGDAAIPVIHVSTDYVFDGGARRPRAYTESDPAGPASVYGQSKLEGERQVLAASPLHTVARSSWLFGVAGRNFVETMLTLAESREAVQVVDDQVGCPTWTGHLAPALIGLAEREVRGLVHLAGAGRVSWNGFAREIFRQAERPCRVEPASTAELARPAPRPAFSAIESERPDVLPLPPWQEGLAGYLAARGGLVRG
jgi:dTDP-4-dehydrorhamnose reductase